MSKSNNYEGGFSYENLNIAWRRVLSSPILDTKDRLGLKIFSANTETHLKILEQQLLDNQYVPSQAHISVGAKNDNGNRLRTFLSVRDRIVYQAIGNIIIRNCFDEVIQHSQNKRIFGHIPTTKDPTNEKYRKNFFTFLPIFKKTWDDRSQHEKFNKIVVQDIERFKIQSNVWMIKTDIIGFYPSIDHNLIRDMLKRRKWLEGEDILDLLIQCLSKWSEVESDSAMSQGVPIGYETSELIAMLYLLDIDIQMDLPNRHDITMRRFVDDMYFFIEGKQQAKEFLIGYDLAIQKRALALHLGKTEIRECNQDLLDQVQSKFIQQNDTSLIRHRLPKMSPQEIIDQIGKLPNISSYPYSDADVKAVKDHLTLISTILYRYKEKDEKLKNIALCILEEMPIKTFHATTYLSLYKNDQSVSDVLSSIFNRVNWYSIHRAECLECWVSINDIHYIKPSLNKWIQDDSQNWVLKNKTIDLLDKHKSLDPNFNVSVYSNYLTRSKVLYHYFFQTSDLDERLRIINTALTDSDYTVQALGLYLLRRDRKIDASKVNTNHLPETLQTLVKSWLNATDDWKEFESLFKELFGLDIQALETKLTLNIPDLSGAIQYLKNMQDAISDPYTYIESLRSFMLEFLSAFISIQSKDKVVIKELKEVFQYIDMSDDRYGHGTISKIENVTRTTSNQHKLKEQIEREIKSLLKFYTDEILSPALPSQINQNISSPTVASSTHYDIFISYRRDDSKDEAKGLHENLAKKLPDRKIFFDEDEKNGIPLAVESFYKSSIVPAIHSCKIFLVVIKDTEKWLKEFEERESKRITDYVLLETTQAFEKKKNITMVFVGNEMKVPKMTSLPPQIMWLDMGQGFHLKNNYDELYRRLEQIMNNLPSD